jgi:predicted nucleic acid-binding protein
MGPHYLLNSSILVHYIRQTDTWLRNIRPRYPIFMLDPLPVVSIISIGEVLSIVNQSPIGVTRQDRVDFILGCFELECLHEPEIIEDYARIDSNLTLRGQSIGKNDLWITATAMHHGCTLLTTDQDYLRAVPLGLHCVVIPTVMKKKVP